MFEFLPHPDIKAKNLEDLTMQTNDYLFRLKESLEFMLMSIDIENLSPEFRSKLDAIGVEIQTANDIREDGMAQMASNALTVEDVINSPLLDGKIEDSLEEVEESIGKKANQSEVDSHTGNSTIHVTASEKNSWNGAVTAILGQLLSNPTIITSEDDVLALEAGVYKADNCQAKNGQSPNALYLVLWGRDGADRHIIEFGANTGFISYNQMFANTWGGWQTLNNYVPVGSFRRVANSDGAGIGVQIGCHSTAKPVYIQDQFNPSYYWFGVYWLNGTNYMLNEISSNGLSAVANAYGTLSPSGGSGTYTFINMIPDIMLW